MIDIIINVLSPKALTLFYPCIVNEHCMKGDAILYIGYERNDIILDIIAQQNCFVVAVDRNYLFRSRKNEIYYIGDFCSVAKGWTKKSMFDCCIVSFSLHENSWKKQLQMMEHAKRVAKKVIIIEPIARKSRYLAKEKEFICLFSPDIHREYAQANSLLQAFTPNVFSHLVRRSWSVASHKLPVQDILCMCWVRE